MQETNGIDTVATTLRIRKAALKEMVNASITVLYSVETSARELHFQ